MAKPITVKILGDAKGLTDALGAAETKLGTFGGVLKGAAVLAGTAFIAAGAGVLKLGMNLDSALDNIIVGTGATGDALAGLKLDFETVAANVPSSFGDVSTAIADLNTRLGLTGEPLQALSEQFLDLSRITKTDVATNIANMTRVFGDAGVATEDQSLALDKMFKVSQATGIGLDRLSTSAVQFGAPMRQLGFSFEESIALFGKFEKEGVNVEAVMSGMKQGLGKMAKAGEDPIATFTRITDEIKNAGSAGEANAIALEAFGQRAGPDMAAAIREGRFETAELVASLDDAGGAIDDTAAATDSWQEKLKVLTNRTMIKLAPIAEAVFNKVGEVVEAVTPYLEDFGDWLAEKIPPMLAKLRSWFERNWPAIRAAVQAVVQWFTSSALPVIVDVFQGIMAAAGVVAEWFRSNWPAIRATIAAVFDWLALEAWPVVKAVFDGLALAVQSVVTWFEENWPTISAVIGAWVTYMTTVVWPALQEVFAFILETVDGLVLWFEENWPKIQETVATVLGAVQAVVETVLAVIMVLWDVFGDHILTAVELVWGLIQTVITTTIQFVQGIIETVMGVITGDWSSAWDGIKTALSAVVDLFGGIVGTALGLVKNAISGAWAGITAAFAAIWDTVWEKASGIMGDIVQAVQDLPGKLLEWAGALLSAGEDLAGDFVQGLKNGLAGMVGFAGDIGAGIIDAIKSSINVGIDAINNFLPNSVGLGPVSVDLPDNPLPRFHSGGFVGSPGGPPVEVPAILQQGEYVMSRSEVARARSGGDGGDDGGAGSLVHIENAHFTNGTDADAFASALNMKVRAA